MLGQKRSAPDFDETSDIEAECFRESNKKVLTHLDRYYTEEEDDILSLCLECTFLHIGTAG